MIHLASILKNLPETGEVIHNLSAGKTPVLATGLSQIHKAGFVAALTEQMKLPGLIVTPDEPSAIRMSEDLCSLFGNEQAAAVYPSRDFMFRDVEGISREYEHERLKILGMLAHTPGKIPLIVASAEAVLQHTIPPEKLKAKTHRVKVGDVLSPESLMRMLVESGYERRDQVDGTCQFSQRGGIVDFYPPHGENPLRVEFWGDEVDGIASFDTDTQRRVDTCETAVITPAREVLYDTREQFLTTLEELAKQQRGKYAAAARGHILKDKDRLESDLSLHSLDKYLPVLYEKKATLFDYLNGALLYVSDPAGIRDSVRGVLLQQQEDMKVLLEEGILYRGSEGFCEEYDLLLQKMREKPTLVMDTFTRNFGDIPLAALYPVNAVQLANWGGELNHLVEDLQSYRQGGYTVAVVTATPKGAATLVQDLQREGIDAEYRETVEVLTPGKVYITAGNLTAGMEFPTLKFAAITHMRAVTPLRRTPRKQRKADPIKSLADLTPGDYVVHVSHGIGVFEGIIKREIHGVIKDYIKIRYAGTDTLFVPVTQLDLVSKYIGGREDGGVKLNKLNSAEWNKTKQRVKSAVADMAEELIKIYAARAAAKGYAFSPDNEWQREFEQRFPFEETDDQLRCVDEIKADMEKETPMDRLLCGDVGFGKTEVAIRAAFKCVMDSKQCAVLVPTTILAWQHFQTFQSRMEGYPIRIELLSRFRTPKQQQEVIRDIKKGLVDIVIGTHRVIQKDVEFKDLGLCIIDEEQRFGVGHKERFKELRSTVDVLTLSATPIPRTLNMAMSGIRDMSLIEEAPMDRHPVQTYVLEHDWSVLVGAMQRELRRGGQVFYLHNRVENIESCAFKIQEFLPEARIVTAHGKMGEEQLASVWKKLIDHEVDILVCTTIIETGVDVANCNTLIIENADRMGLSQLYQLRGRVGRSSRRAFAYLTFTRGKQLTEIATKRLLAIKEFTSFGSGFRIAMRDLEIRGAGNVLGAQQHGHMEAVGYDMYLRLLGEAVGEQRGEAPARTSNECMVDINIGAHIPESYIENLSQRIDIYKKIAAIMNEEDAMDVVDELIDRFGDPPQAVKGLVDVALVRGTASRMGIREISQKQENILLYPEHLDVERASNLASRLKGRVMVNAGAKPYLQVKGAKGQKPLDTIREALEMMA